MRSKWKNGKRGAGVREKKRRQSSRRMARHRQQQRDGRAYESSSSSSSSPSMPSSSAEYSRGSHHGWASSGTHVLTLAACLTKFGRNTPDSRDAARGGARGAGDAERAGGEEEGDEGAAAVLFFTSIAAPSRLPHRPAVSTRPTAMEQARQARAEVMEAQQWQQKVGQREKV